MSKFLYILDNGHGADTKGKRSPVWKDGTQLLEFEFNRNVVKYLSFMLKQAKIRNIVNVTEENDISLSERCKRANNSLKDGDNAIFISIHSNAFKNEKVNGFEVHYYTQDNLAQVFQDQLKVLGNDRGIKKSNFYVLKHTTMPAILTENGFYTNEEECKRLLTPEFQYKIAEAHFKAIKIIEYTNEELYKS